MVPCLPTEKISASELRVVHLPPSVRFSVFERCVDIAERLRTYEGKPTGCILVLADDELACRPLSNFASKLVHQSIIDDQLEGSLREAFAADGGMLIDGQSGEILATKVRFPTPPKPCFVLEGTGSRHSEGFEVACVASCVAITRSQDGYVTIFSSEHLQCSPDEARCFRVRDENEQGPQGQFEVVIQRTPLVRFAANGKMEVPKQASDALSSLEAPLQVVAFVGPGRTGKSTLAGKVAGNGSLFPAARVLDAVTDGIDAVAIQNPSTEGTLLLLDSEGFHNVFAKSRPKVATLCLLLSSQIVFVDYDRFDDNMMASLARLSACREVMMPSEACSDNLDPEPPELVVVVNGSRFHDLYDSETLEKALSSDEGSSKDVRKHFPWRHFVSIPNSTATDFETHICTLQTIVLQAPMMVTAGIGLLGKFEPANRLPFDGHMFRDLVTKSVALINTTDCIKPREVYQSVLHEHNSRCIQQVLNLFKDRCPLDGPYRPRLPYLPEDAMREAEAAAIGADAKQELKKILDDYYKKCVWQNTAKGEAIDHESEDEKKEIEVGDPKYEKVSRWGKIVAGSGAGALSSSAAALLFPPAVPFAACGGAVAGGTMAMVGKDQINVTQRYEILKRKKSRKVNRGIVYGNWEHVEYVYRTWTQELA